jgi:amidase
MTDDELAFAPALELAELVRAGKISPVELVDVYLARIDALDPVINSYITVAIDQARAAARKAERAIEEAGDGAALAPFHGVPISIKDLTDTAGIRTTLGSAVFRDRVPDVDAYTVRKLVDAGFIVIGKTNTPEFGIGSTDPVGYGPCRNPWDTERTVGGSSGGAAAALAAGLCPVSHGSDAGGSIRMPASFCGVVGLKPSRGRVSAGPLPSMLAQEGPIARTVADAAALLDVLAGHQAGDPFWASDPARPFQDEAGEQPQALRIAFTADVPLATTRPASAAAIENVARLLAELGHKVEPGAPKWPTGDAALETAKKVRDLTGATTEGADAAAGAAAEEATAQLGAPRDLYSVFGARMLLVADQIPSPELLDPIVQTLLEDVGRLTLKQYLAIEAGMYLAAQKTAQFFEEWDVLVTPTVPYAPPLVTELRSGSSSYQSESMFATCTWNMTGQPAISLPLAVDEDGLPLGIQLVGRPGDERTLIQVAAQLEAAAPWHDRRPPGC